MRSICDSAEENVDDAGDENELNWTEIFECLQVWKGWSEVSAQFSIKRPISLKCSVKYFWNMTNHHINFIIIIMSLTLSLSSFSLNYCDYQHLPYRRHHHHHHHHHPFNHYHCHQHQHQHPPVTIMITRAKLPLLPWVRPAFWLMPDGAGVYGGWPSSGEIGDHYHLSLVVDILIIIACGGRYDGVQWDEGLPLRVNLAWRWHCSGCYHDLMMMRLMKKTLVMMKMIIFADQPPLWAKQGSTLERWKNLC